MTVSAVVVLSSLLALIYKSPRLKTLLLSINVPSQATLDKLEAELESLTSLDISIETTPSRNTQ